MHTHILHGIDDGAKDISESMKLIELEIENNVGTIVLTPHFNPYIDSVEEFVQKRRENYDVLLQNIQNTQNAQNIRDKDIALVPGSETYYSSMLMYYSTLMPLCISGTRYLLIEFSEDTVFSKDFFAEFETFMEKFDIVPIIAHIERYKYINKHINAIRKLKQLGCIIQVNANYLFHNIENRFVKRLLKHECIDIIASDCHDSRRRPPNLMKAIALIDEKYNGYYSKILTQKHEIISEKLQENQNKC